MDIARRRGIARFGLLLAAAGVAAGPILVREARRCRAARQERQARGAALKFWAGLCEGWPRRFTDPQGRRWTLADLRPGVRITEANFSGVSWERADLRGVRFDRCDLSLTNLRGADMRDADLRGCHIGGTDFSFSDLRGADLRDTDDGVGGACHDFDEAFPIFRGALYDHRTRWDKGFDPHTWGMRLVE